MTKVLVTGASGSGASYLIEHILSTRPQWKIFGISRWGSTRSLGNLRSVINDIQLIECDLTDQSSVWSAFQNSSPDVVINLAAHANVRASFDSPRAIMDNNIHSTLNIFETCRLSGKKPLILHCSTSEVYGQVFENEIPIKETQPLRPASPYAISKITQDLIAESYGRAYDIPVIRTRMFSYLNPRRKDLFATAFASQIAKIELNQQAFLLHGNLESLRTIVDVRDACEAYCAAIEHCKAGEVYNIGGDHVISVGDFLTKLKSLATCEISSKLDPKLLRPADVTLQIPDVKKFKAATGWATKYSIDESVENLLNECREAVKNSVDM